MKRLNVETWRNIFRNLEEDGLEVEVIWLDNVPGPGEYGLCYDCELFEDGFASEAEAVARLEYMRKEVGRA